MNEFLTVTGIAVICFGVFVFWISLMSFLLWENGFRILKPIFLLRVFIVTVVWAWLFHFIPWGK
ncbi:hypothetical protein ACONGJ_003567 [Edwardsiella piscicida]